MKAGILVLPGKGFPPPVTPLLVGYWLILTENVITAVSFGFMVPTVAVTDPAEASTGAVIVPLLVAAAGVALYLVFAGVASSTETADMAVVPWFTAVIWYMMQAPGFAPVVI